MSLERAAALPGPQAPLPLLSRDVRGADGFLAFQTDGLVAQVAEHLRVNGPRPCVHASGIAGMPDPGSSIHAYSFRAPPAVHPSCV